MNLFLTALIGIASWYGPELEGRPTASGEPFDPSEYTAASWHHPFGTILEIRNTETGKTVQVRVNDRGPARHLDRIIDLSQAGFAEIADLDKGLVEVEIHEIKQEDQDEQKSPDSDTSET